MPTLVNAAERHSRIVERVTFGSFAVSHMTHELRSEFRLAPKSSQALTLRAELRFTVEL